MKKLCIGLGWVVLMAVSVFGAELFLMVDSEDLSITNTPIGLTQSKYYNASTKQTLSNYASVVIELTGYVNTVPGSGPWLRYTTDGVTTPSSTVGIPVSDGSMIVLQWEELRNFRIYCDTTATGHVVYKKYSRTN